MDSVNEAFKRAALYQACKHSSILANIKFESADSDTLIELVNQHNAHSIRELPILLSKAMAKFVISFLIKRFPKLQPYVNPDTIRVRIEDDELAYLISTSSKGPRNICMIVLKNIAIGSLGSSIELMKASFMQKDPTPEVPDLERIEVKLNSKPLVVGTPPTTISEFGSSKRGNSPIQLDRLDSETESVVANEDEPDTKRRRVSDDHDKESVCRLDEPIHPEPSVAPPSPPPSSHHSDDYERDDDYMDHYNEDDSTVEEFSDPEDDSELTRVPEKPSTPPKCEVAIVQSPPAREKSVSPHTTNIEYNVAKLKRGNVDFIDLAGSELSSLAEKLAAPPILAQKRKLSDKNDDEFNDNDFDDAKSVKSNDSNGSKLRANVQAKRPRTDRSFDFID